MNTKHTIWVEKYRPDTLENYVSSDTVREKLREYIDTQDIPHLLFYGTAGTGKTTAAKLLVNNIHCDHLFINASDERGIDTIRDKLKNFASTIGFAPLKIIVLDEADAITPDGQRALRNLMEAYSENTRFILTANYVERISEPLISRSQVFKLTPPSKKEAAKNLARILKEEGVEFDIQTVAQLVNAYYPDIRKIIGTSQLQTRDNKLQISIDELISSDFKLKIIEILSQRSALKDRINAVRQLVADNDVQDFTELYRLLFDNVDEYFSNNIPHAIKCISEGMYRDGQVPDKEINFIATLFSILTE